MGGNCESERTWGATDSKQGCSRKTHNSHPWHFAQFSALNDFEAFTVFPFRAWCGLGTRNVRENCAREKVMRG